MFVIRRKGWEIPESRVTPEGVYLSRRDLLAAAGGLTMLGTVAAAGAEGDQTIDLYPATRNIHYAADRTVTPESVSTRYNNFLEFGAQKDVWRKAEALQTRPWQVTVDGLVEQPLVIGIDDLVRRLRLEERIYRHRAVEGWSMVVPWTGFPVSALLALAKPLGSARYVRLESFNDPDMASGQRNFWPWPYVEGLTIEEAGNDLAFLVTGAYGKPAARVMGAPLRLHLPWKYGFKSIKSVTRITLTDERPTGFWQQVRAREYGFWANVNPDVAHPRWSQASERDIATGEKIPTQLFNGYGEYVAGLYADMKSEDLFR